MNMIKPLLEEAKSEDIATILSSCPVREWTNMKMIENISREFNFGTEKAAKEIILKELRTFWKAKCNINKNTARAVKRAGQLYKTVSSVVESDPILLIIRHNIEEQKKPIRQQSRASIRNRIIEQGYEDAANSLSCNHDSIASTEENDSATTDGEVAQKKRKHLNLKYFKKLDNSNKLIELNKFYGTNDALNFTKTSSIPKRFANDVQHIKETYGLTLPFILRNDEYSILKKLSHCHSKEDLYHAVENINSFSNESCLPYIKLAVQKLCNLYHNKLLLNSNNNEVWYRSIVYGDLFDYIFAVQPYYITKRSECHSAVIKSMKRLGLVEEDEHDVRLDFIFTNIAVAGLGDALFCEDKPTDKVSKKDETKACHLREKSLVYWKSLLPYDACLNHLTAISCQFNKLKLIITGTKIVNGIIMHSRLKEVNIPCSDQSGAMLANYLATVISLMRTVIRNFKVIETIMYIVQEDNLVFLSSDTNETCFREDSDSSSEGSIVSPALPNWEAAEREDRIMKKIEASIKSLNETDEGRYVPSFWEDIVFNTEI